MGRKSNKTESERIEALQAKINSLRGVEAEKKFSNIKVIENLRLSQNDIRRELANSKPLLAKEGIRSFDVRIVGAQLKAKRYIAEKEYNTLLSTFGTKIDSNLSTIMSECVLQLEKNVKIEIVEAYAAKAQKTFQKENSEILSRIEKAREVANLAITACANHSIANTSNSIEGEKKKDFFKPYSSFTI